MPAKIGIYRHYKGQIYQVLHFGFDSETLQKIVVYQGQYKSLKFGDFPVFVRPFSDFFAKVSLNGLKKPRFEFIDI